MLTLFRRHLIDCKHAKKGRKYRTCGCPLAVEGKLHGAMIRRALDLRNWEAAQKLVREWEVNGDKPVVTVSVAYERFLAQRKAKGMSADMLHKHEKLGLEMQAFLGDIPLRSITLDGLSEFRESWTIGPGTAKNQIARMRSFFRFCIDRQWIERNLAKLIEMPKVDDSEPKPYEPGELVRINEAIDQFPNKGIYGEMTRERLRAFVAVLRWTGMRIGDAVQLPETIGANIKLRTTKNGKHVSVPTHPEIEIGIQKIKKGKQYLFWSGEGTVKSQVSCWERTFKKLSKIAKIHIHAHRWRHTFIVNLLSKGVPVSEVAALAGNSPRIIERHYNQWIQSRQDALDKAFMGTWT
jgi:integrase